MPDTIRDLDLLTYLEKLDHWNIDGDPWRPPEGRYRFENPKLGKFRTTMLDGNITRMPKLIGRPCFGILTAYLRYRGAIKFVRGRGIQPASRCGDCKVKQQCGDVVRRRIETNPRLTQAYQDWMLADGPSDIREPGWRKRPSGGRWRHLAWIASQTPFSSSNDKAVLDHYEQQDRLQRDRDAARKRRERQRDRREGVIDEQHVLDIEAAVKRRAVRLVAAITEAKLTDTPRALSRLKKESVKDLLEVWLGRELLIARRQRPTAARIARWITETNRSNRSVTPDALATRVRKDLRRIEQLEERPWSDGVVLPSFDPTAEFTT